MIDIAIIESIAPDGLSLCSKHIFNRGIVLLIRRTSKSTFQGRSSHRDIPGERSKGTASLISSQRNLIVNDQYLWIAGTATHINIETFAKKAVPCIKKTDDLAAKKIDRRF